MMTHGWSNKRFVAPTRPLWLAVGLIASFALEGALGQEVQQAAAVALPNKMSVSVSEIQQEGQLIRVPVHKAVMLKFNVPVDEPRLINGEIADVTAMSPHQLVVTGKSFGTTQLIVKSNGNGEQVFDIAVDVELDRLAASIRSTVPRADVDVYSLMDAVVLTGTAPDTVSAEKIVEISEVFADRVINHLQIAGAQQVLLRCTVAEVNRTATRALGFNGWMAGDNFPSAFGLSNVGGINPTNIGAAGGAIVSPPQALGNTTAAPIGGIVPFVTDDGGIPVSATTTLSVGFPQLPMQVFVRALRENGLLKVLAEPNLVAISGEEATFLAGGSFPVPVPQDAETITITFQEFGVRLNFTPAVLSEGRIRLKVTPEISEPDFSTAVQVQGFFVPGLVQRRVQTVVECGSGQTIAIGGLLSERTRGVTEKVPGLGDLPILGPLFSSVEYQHEETEMLVLVTPELVGPISPQQVTYVPGASHVAPNDIELFLMGKLEGDNTQQTPRLTPRVNRAYPATQPEDHYGAAAALRLRGPIGPTGGGAGM